MSKIKLSELLDEFEEVEVGIFSCLDRNDRHSSYDNKVNLYDRIVGNPFYNRLIWGNWPSNYRDFCRRALASQPDGIYLDAGCGSLVFTASMYAAASSQPIILLDRSLGMLIKGRDRMRKLHGTVPENIIFLQADIFHLPFPDHVINTIASFGVLHIFEDKLSLLTELERVKKNDGQIFISSLVGNNLIGREYLTLLAQANEVASPHSSETLSKLLSAMPCRYTINSIGNMAYIRDVS